MRLISLVGLTISLFVLGLIGLLRIGTYGLESKINEQFSVSVIIPASLSPEREAQLRQRLTARAEVAALRYISRDEAAEEIARGLGQSVSEMLAPLGGNPFDAVYELRIAAPYVHRDSLRRLEADMQAEGLELGLSARGALLEQLADNTRLVEWLSWGALLVLGLLTYIQLSNTVRLVIYAERLSIRILTLVGARAWFVRAPFVGRAVLDGLLSTVLALLALAGVVLALEHLGGLPVLSVLAPRQLALGSGLLLAVAVVSTALSAARATHRYIRMRSGLIHLD